MNDWQAVKIKTKIKKIELSFKSHIDLTINFPDLKHHFFHT